MASGYAVPHKQTEHVATPTQTKCMVRGRPTAVRGRLRCSGIYRVGRPPGGSNAQCPPPAMTWVGIQARLSA